MPGRSRRRRANRRASLVGGGAGGSQGSVGAAGPDGELTWPVWAAMSQEHRERTWAALSLAERDELIRMAPPPPTSTSWLVWEAHVLAGQLAPGPAGAADVSGGGYNPYDDVGAAGPAGAASGGFVGAAGPAGLLA